MSSRLFLEAGALASVGGAFFGYLPHIAAIFGVLYWMAMFITKIPEVLDAIRTLQTRFWAWRISKKKNEKGAD